VQFNATRGGIYNAINTQDLRSARHSGWDVVRFQSIRMMIDDCACFCAAIARDGC